ncbi:hypothetical protein R8Z50_22455 [Longispora sp. K20-0274]|uniref:hypothetical protein n=1 Tax=Longispora sp. K20-0274 TaxID=3088255 RepID=UPI00399BE692
MRKALHRPLRLAIASLLGLGVVLAWSSVPAAVARIGRWQGVVFLVVGVGLTVLAIGVVRGVRWASVIAVVGLAGQPLAVAGTLWELAYGIDAGKARELRLLGFEPTVGVTVNLAYSVVASALFGWFALRWWRARRTVG